MVSDWVYESNLRPFLEAVSQLVGYGFDELDRDAVTLGLVQVNDSDGDEWFDYQLGGARVRARGEYLVFIEVEFPEYSERGVEAVVTLMQNYVLTPSGP